MKSFKCFAASAIAIASVLTAAAATASPVVYFGENQSPGAAVSGDPVTARNSFLAGLTGVSTQTFESFSTGSAPPLALAFNGSSGTINATITGAGSINTAGNGRFNTTTGGSKFYESSGAFNITFDQAISAFGFYGTDIGDFNGQVTLTLTGGGTTTLTVPNTVNGNDGSLLFFGFTDSTAAYTGISFGNTSGGADVFGFDDLVIGDRAQITGAVPEPGSAAMLAIALFGLAAAKRRKQQR